MQPTDSKPNIKDASLWLLSEPRAPLQKSSIDDSTSTHSSHRRRLCRLPWFLLLMSFVEILLYLIADACMQRRLIYKPKLGHEYWRFFTYMLLHADLWHLWINICLQCFIGVYLEVEQGHWRLAVVYLTGGLCGGLANASLQPGLALIGASAGVYAMLCSHVPHLVLNFSKLSHRTWRVAVLLILFVSNVAYTVYHFCLNDNRNPRISLEAHLGGGVAGLICGFLVYKRISSETPSL
ncbi:PREDICTED: protein rhomboid [Drosophila arizonae]|uniref:Protein rhomboid n=1 Tax=Drosophila arizonae TaxID=7263 RepID=A0ABM1NYB1_DROAR|nr:PREDICTED: protein rhomboid [Drosophila arizonae]